MSGEYELVVNGKTVRVVADGEIADTVTDFDDDTGQVAALAGGDRADHRARKRAHATDQRRSEAEEQRLRPYRDEIR